MKNDGFPSQHEVCPHGRLQFGSKWSVQCPQFTSVINMFTTLYLSNKYIYISCKLLVYTTVLNIYLPWPQHLHNITSVVHIFNPVYISNAYYLLYMTLVYLKFNLCIITSVKHIFTSVYLSNVYIYIKWTLYKVKVM